MKTQDRIRAQDYFDAKLAFSTGPVELHTLIEKRARINIIDVRASEDYDKGHIPGAVNLPHEKWVTLEGMTQDRMNVIYCYSQQCHLAAHAALFFAKEGFPVQELEGGFEAYHAHGFALEMYAHIVG